MTTTRPTSRFFAPLRRLLPQADPRRSPLHLPDGMRPGEGGKDGQVVARALCRFRHVALDAIPPADRQAYLRTQLLAWTPFDETAIAIALESDHAAVFAWDRRQFEARARAAGVPVAPRTVWPETVLMPRHAEGPVLQRCTGGVEGQVWHAGRLVASRWWPAAPDAAAWLNFQRGAGLAPDRQQPAVPELPADEGPIWLAQPWVPVQTPSGMAERARLRTHAVAAVGLAALLLPTLWLAHARWATAQQVSALDATRQSLTASAQPLLTARSEALSALATLDALAAQVNHPRALDLLTHLSEHLPADGSRIRKLEWDGPRLRLVLSVPEGTSRIAYVGALEGGGWLQNVREDTQDATAGTVVLAAEVGAMPATMASADAAASAPAATAATTTPTADAPR